MIHSSVKMCSKVINNFFVLDVICLLLLFTYIGYVFVAPKACLLQTDYCISYRFIGYRRSKCKSFSLCKDKDFQKIQSINNHVFIVYAAEECTQGSSPCTTKGIKSLNSSIQHRYYKCSLKLRYNILIFNIMSKLQRTIYP